MLKRIRIQRRVRSEQEMVTTEEQRRQNRKKPSNPSIIPIVHDQTSIAFPIASESRHKAILPTSTLPAVSSPGPSHVRQHLPSLAAFHLTSLQSGCAAYFACRHFTMTHCTVGTLTLSILSTQSLLIHSLLLTRSIISATRVARSSTSIDRTIYSNHRNIPPPPSPVSRKYHRQKWHQRQQTPHLRTRSPYPDAPHQQPAVPSSPPQPPPSPPAPPPPAPPPPNPLRNNSGDSPPNRPT